MRLPKLSYDQLTPRQREAHDKHAAKRERVSGPYAVWLHSPEVDLQPDRTPPFADVRGHRKTG